MKKIKKSKPGEMFNKFQSKKKKAMAKMAMPAIKGAATAGKVAKPLTAKPFVPTYGGKVGGKMSNGVGWGGGKMKKGKKKATKKKGKLKKKVMCKKHKKSMCKMCGK